MSALLAFKPSMLAAARAQFPRRCRTCGASFATLASLLERTRALGKPLLDEDDSELDAVGLTCFANCACHSTLAVVYEDTREHAAFNRAVRAEASRTGQPIAAVLEWITQLVSDEGRLPSADEAPRVAAPPDPMMLEIGAAIVEMVSRSTIQIPPYPGVALKLRAIVASGAGGVREIADVVAHDPGLAIAALRLANSTFFRRGDPVTSLGVAVSRIGASELERVALSMAMAEHSAGSGSLAPLRRQLWHASVATAVLARHLAAARKLSAEDCFACGLLHNVAGLVATLNLEAHLSKHPELPVRPLAWWSRLIEVFNADVGKAVAATWDLSALLTEAICVHRRDAAEHSANRAVHEVVLAAAAVAKLAASRPRTTAADLRALGHRLAPHELELLLRVLPQCPEVIASFETPNAPPQQNEPREKSGEPGIKILSQASIRARLQRCDASSVTLRTSGALLENFLNRFSFSGDSAFVLWAKTESCAPAGSEYEVRARPFGLDDATEKRWLAFVEMMGNAERGDRAESLDRQAGPLAGR